ncbi:MAG: hypothetical protein R6V58_06400 [Planctomycetota bacterium]
MMFPDLDRLQLNKPLAGHAFEVLVESRGIGASSRQVKTKPDGWDECTACESYRECHDLSMARPALGAALAART